MDIEKLKPRNNCFNYVLERGGKAFLLKKKEFNNLCRAKKFSDGPHRDSFGDGYGEPYNPNRQAFGILGDGKIVYCELSGGKDAFVEVEKSGLEIDLKKID